MSTKQLSGEDEQIVRRYEYEDSWVLAAEIGLVDEDIDVDIVGETAIVVADTPEGVSEAEFELPDSDVSVETKNGVLTITVEK